MLKKCSCPSISFYPIEEKLIEKSNYYKKSNIGLEDGRENIQCLKNLIISEYYSVINLLECGILPDIKSILEKIIYILNYEWKQLFK